MKQVLVSLCGMFVMLLTLLSGDETVVCQTEAEREGVTVWFHTLLSPHWQFDQRNKNHVVKIRFGNKGLGNWKKNVVEMKVLNEM